MPSSSASHANHPADATRAVEDCLASLGRIDVLVNSSSSSAIPALLHDTPIEDIASLLNGQALAPMHMSRAALPSMRAQGGGVIVNVASDAAKSATPGETILGAGMAAIVMFRARSRWRPSATASASTPSRPP